MLKLFSILFVLLFTIVPVESKTYNIVIGSVAGGGPDTSARMMARHISKHMGDESKFVVQNMPGAGGLIVANWLYNVADPETTIGSFTVLNNTLLNAILGNENAKFDPMKFRWLFSTADGADGAIVLWANRTRGLENVQQLLTPNNYVIGSQSTGEFSIQNVLVTDVLASKARFVTGYKNILTAIQNNEVDAYIGNLQSAKTTHRDYLVKGNVIHPILQMGRNTRHPDLQHVPVLSEFVTNEKDLELLRFFNLQTRMSRVYMMPPKASDDVVRRIIAAGEKMRKDPEYLAELEKMGLESSFINSQELSEIVRQLVNTPKPTLDYLRQLAKN